MKNARTHSYGVSTCSSVQTHQPQCSFDKQHAVAPGTHSESQLGAVEAESPASLLTHCMHVWPVGQSDHPELAAAGGGLELHHGGVPRGHQVELVPIVPGGQPDVLDDASEEHTAFDVFCLLVEEREG